jgi:hypothetical protein
VRCSSWVPLNPRFTGDDEIGPLSLASAFSPKKEGAREEWYNDFAERAQTQYDLLGHIVDLMRTLCTSIENYYVIFENEDSWMEADKLKKSKRPKPTGGG